MSTSPKRALPGTRTVVRSGRPVVVHNREPVSQAIYCDYILRGDWEDRVREFVDSGVKVFHLQCPHGTEGGGEEFHDNAFWIADGRHPADDFGWTFSYERQATAILKMQPEARFYIKFLLTPPLDWTRKHPGDMQTDEDGKTFREASWASERLQADLRRFIQTLVRYCESRPWGERVIGYLGCPYGEGIMPLNIAGKMFDCSAANETAFRDWVKAKYRSAAALRKAWCDPDAALDAVRVPRDREWLLKKAQGPATIDGKPVPLDSLPSNAGQTSRALFHWVEHCNAARERDYCLFMRDTFLRWSRTILSAIKDTAAEFGRSRLAGLDIVKQHQIGWQILSSFDGIGDGQSFASMFPLSGSIGMRELIDDDLLDTVWNPADYYARTLGFAYESEGLTDSFVIRGKTAMVENDARCYVGIGVKDQGAFRTPAEVEAGLLRNAALTLSRGAQSYWCNVGSSYFHDPKIHKTISRITPMLDALNEAPHRETEHAIAMVVDDESPLYEDFTSGYQTLALILQRIRGLAHCGVPYRILLLSDLEQKALPRYRTWLFPNLFRLDDGVMALLKKKVLRDGNVAVFGPATGITDGTRLSADGASALLGVPMELVPRTTVRHVVVHDNGHPLTRELPANLVYGDSMPYGPTLVPGEWAVENAGAVPLGHANTCWFIHRTGLFVREFGKGAAGNRKPGKRTARDYAAVWSVAMPIPSAVLRACARFAGSNIWCEQDDVVYASDSLVALHSMKAGARTIRLPRACRVHDAITGKPVGSGRTRKIELRIKPPETRIFTLRD